MKKLLLTLCICFAIVLSASAQLREVYNWPYTQTELTGMSFYQPGEGFIITERWLGYTTDSGHTFIQKDISTTNVDFGPYSPSLTFPFAPYGIHAFNQDTLLVYGTYTFVPSILYSTNGGASYKLIFYSSYGSDLNLGGINSMVFPANGNVGFATDKDRVLRSTDRGKTWNAVFTVANAGFRYIDFPVNSNQGYIAASTTFWRTTNGGTSWSNSYGIYNPGNEMYSGVSFINNSKGWVSRAGTVYYTSNGGSSWVQKNDKNKYSTAVTKFVNDSTGYTAGGEFEVYKTTDSGRIWERVQRNNNYSYLGYSSVLFFYNGNQFWSGGSKYPHLELTTNGGGITLPRAVFTMDTSQLTPTNTIQLLNDGKQRPEYSYRWIRNRVQIATTFNTSYLTPRNTIDTIQLIASKGPYQDTATQTINTRLPVVVPPCKAAFTFAADTATVKFTPRNNDTTWKHYWYFADGIVDSTIANPVHTYARLPSTLFWYPVTHVVKSNYSASCYDSATVNVTLIRLQRCMVPDFTVRSDTFFTAQTYGRGTFSLPTEMNPAFRGTWNFGDGTSATIAPQTYFPYSVNHKYDSSKTYQACLTITNDSTGCVSSICKPVTITLTPGCDASFRMLNSTDSAAPGYNYVDTGINFRGRPLAINSGKRHTWAIDAQTFTTGNRNAFNNSLKRTLGFNEGYAFGEQCRNFYNLKEVQLDSPLVKTIRHTVYDSSTNCTDTKLLTVPLPRTLDAPRLDMYFNPDLPQKVLYTTYNGNNLVYANFQAKGQFQCCSASPIAYRNYTSTQDDIVMFMPMSGSSCIGNDVYFKKVHVDYEACAIISPHIVTTRSSSNPLSVTFYDTAITYGAGLYPSPLLSNSEEGMWFFGDGDSTRTFGYTVSSAITHTYTAAGNYLVSRRQKSEDGCYKLRSAWITVGSVAAPACSVVPRFYTSKDGVQPGTIKFINYTTPDNGSVTYKWYFGNGDSSTQKKPVYTYRASGTYLVRLQATYNGCTQTYDSTLSVTYLPCNTPTDFRDTTLYVVCGNEVVNIGTLYNTGSLPIQWSTGNLQSAGIGTYRLIAQGGTPCRDTAIVTVKQDIARWTGAASSNWSNAANWSTGKIPVGITHVIISNTATNVCNLDVDVAVASLQVKTGAVFRILNSHTVVITAACNPLPN